MQGFERTKGCVQIGGVAAFCALFGFRMVLIGGHHPEGLLQAMPGAIRADFDPSACRAIAEVKPRHRIDQAPVLVASVQVVVGDVMHDRGEGIISEANGEFARRCLDLIARKFAGACGQSLFEPWSEVGDRRERREREFGVGVEQGVGDGCEHFVCTSFHPLADASDSIKGREGWGAVGQWASQNLFERAGEGARERDLDESCNLAIREDQREDATIGGESAFEITGALNGDHGLARGE